MVGVGGLEPPTSSSRTMRATNCATLRLTEVIIAESGDDLMFKLIAGINLECPPNKKKGLLEIVLK
jgi:hypothetical protein